MKSESLFEIISSSSSMMEAIVALNCPTESIDLSDFIDQNSFLANWEAWCAGSFLESLCTLHRK